MLNRVSVYVCAACILAISLSVASQAMSQGVDEVFASKVIEFVPRNYIFVGTPVGSEGHRKSLLFQAQFGLQLPIVSNLREQAEKSRNWAFSLSAFMLSDIRMFEDLSNPVRMPSYKPGGDLQLYRFVHHSPHKRSLWGIRAGFYHYSNGQDGCTFHHGVTDDTLECWQVFRHLENVKDELNRTSGQFSTNRISSALNYKYFRLNRNSFAIRHTMTFGLRADWNIRGMIDNELRDLYGWGRLEANAELVRMLESDFKFSVRGELGYSPDSGDRIPEFDGAVEVSIFPPYKALGNVGLFVRYRAGRDNYNAFFVDNFHQSIFGITFNQFRKLSFDELEE